MNKSVIITLIITVALIGLFVLGNKTQENNVTYFGDTEIACLKNGHQNLAEHIHPELKITVDGELEQIPANIGVTQDCMSEIHTHDGTGKIHAESFLAGRIDNFNLGHFFTVWNQDHMRDGYDLEIIQDGEIKNSIEEVKFIDLSKTELKYTSKI
jgi:hypothetical protein